MTTKKTTRRQNAHGVVGEMRAEYRLDYGRSRPNRFARMSEGYAVTVVLDPDVAEVFTDSKSVNSFLRSAIAAMPGRKKPKKRAAASRSR